MTFKEFTETDLYKSNSVISISIDGKKIDDDTKIEDLNDLQVIGTGSHPKNGLLIDLVREPLVYDSCEDLQLEEPISTKTNGLVRFIIMSIVIILLGVIIMLQQFKIKELEEHIELFEYQEYVMQDCYRCDSSNVRIYPKGDEYYIKCNDCNTSTDYHDSLVDLIKEWNSKW